MRRGTHSSAPVTRCVTHVAVRTRRRVLQEFEVECALDVHNDGVLERGVGVVCDGRHFKGMRICRFFWQGVYIVKC